MVCGITGSVVAWDSDGAYGAVLIGLDLIADGVGGVCTFEVKGVDPIVGFVSGFTLVVGLLVPWYCGVGREGGFGRRMRSSSCLSKVISTLWRDSFNLS